MSKPMKSNPLPGDDLEDDEKNSSPRSMIFTMLLLTTGLLFASILLIQHAAEKKSKDGEPIFNLIKLADQVKPPTHIRKPASSGKDEAKQTGMSSPFPGIKHFIEDQTGNAYWPRLELTGFGRSTTDKAENFAIINGEVFHHGEYIGSVKLVEIQEHGVIVEYNGERKTLTVNTDD